jgi:hypothetical protein
VTDPLDLAVELQKIYDSEINVRIGWLWDCGIEVRLGDDANGYQAADFVKTVADIVPWLQDAIAHFYPNSTYAASLSPELIERAAKRLFHPPKIGAQVICPFCGSPNASILDEVFIFVCNHCGNSVTVDPPPIQ